MFELSVIHRPGMVNGKQDIGRILEAMLYYDRVHLVMDGQLFTGLWDVIGPDNLMELVSHQIITTSLTPEFLAIAADKSSGLTIHRAVAMKMSGRPGKLIHDDDDAGTLVALLQTRPDWAIGHKSKVAKILKKTEKIRYGKILDGQVQGNERFMSLAKDEETLKLFLRGWAISHHKYVNEDNLNKTKINFIDAGAGEFLIDSTIPIQNLVSSWDPNENWATILANIQDYSVDLHLSETHSADIIVAPAISEVASARLSMSIQRSLKSQQNIHAFEEIVFDEAHGFSQAINSKKITFSEAIKVIDQSRKFRTWTKGLSPNAILIKEYNKAISKETILGKFPASFIRFAVCTGLGFLADKVFSPGAGIAISAADAFVVDRTLRGWRPNIFVNNVQKTLDRARDRSFERGE